MNKFKYLLVLILIYGLVGLGCDNSKNIYTISGVVEKVEYIAEGSSFNSPDIKYTIVSFSDGRKKAFKGISQELFFAGKENIITYSHFNMYSGDRIIKVEKVKP